MWDEQICSNVLVELVIASPGTEWQPISSILTTDPSTVFIVLRFFWSFFPEIYQVELTTYYTLVLGLVFMLTFFFFFKGTYILDFAVKVF